MSGSERQPADQPGHAGSGDETLPAIGGTAHGSPTRPLTTAVTTVEEAPAGDAMGEATVTLDEAARRQLAAGRQATSSPQASQPAQTTSPAPSTVPQPTSSPKVAAIVHRTASGVSTHLVDEADHGDDDEQAVTFAALDAESATRREGVDTRQDLDNKIRAHLERAGAVADPLIGQTIAGRFLVLKKIGSGGMGSVYRARQEGIDRDVAIKVLLGDLTRNDTVLRRFTLEALAVSRLRHPNTIQIFDYGQTSDGNPYIAMEFLDGHSLYDLLRKERPLPIRRALRIMAQVAQSLAEAHSKEIVHRDLKPENIFLVTVGSNADYVKVLDFGVAKLRDHKSDQGTLTQAGSIFGTPRYMSPEQCGAQPVDHRSDLYALGVILYEMVTGRPPFTHDQPLGLLLAHVNEQPLPPSAATDRQVIPAGVEELVLRLLEKLPDDRLPSADDLARRCEALAASLPEAFDQRVGTAQEAESLGVRLAQPTSHELPTARTLKLAAAQLASDSAGAPQLAMPIAIDAPPPPDAPRRWPLWLGGLAATGVAGWLALRPPQVVVQRELVTQEVQVPVAVGSPDSASIRVTLNSNPPGARVLAGERLLGTTNASIERPRGAPAETWRLVRDGFEPYTLQVSFGQAQVFNIDLKPTAAQAAPTRPVKPAEPAKSAVKAQGPAKVEPPPAAAPPPAPPKPEVAKPVEPAKPEPPKKKKDDLLDDLQ
jgi:serine/threonine protein kinase